MTTTKKAMLLKHLEAGKEFTAKQISASFGYKNPYRAVEYLRSEGHCVYANTKTLSTGERVVKYRIGKPSKRMVALANQIMGAAAFTR
jgi:hypothetical protein